MVRSDLEFLPLDDEIVAFSEEAQCLIGLNASAARVVRRIQAGNSLTTIASELSSEGVASPEEATKWVASVLTALGSHGLLNDGSLDRSSSERPDDERYLARMANEMPAYAPVVPVAEQHYRLLDTCVGIRFGHLAQVRLVNAVIGHLATDNRCTSTVTLEIKATILEDKHLRSDVYRDGKPIAYATRLSRLGPLVKGALWSDAVNAYDFLFYIHAGVVGADETCLLLPAAQGSGKSSLTAALTHKGFRYFSDEVALIDGTTFHVPPVPLAFCVKNTGWDLIARYFPQILAVPTHWRDDGKEVRYVPPPPDMVQKASAPVSHIIFPRYDGAHPTEIRPTGRSEALGRVMDQCLALRQRLTRENVAKLVRWIRRIQCYSLTFSSSDEAADLVREIAIRDGCLKRY